MSHSNIIPFPSAGRLEPAPVRRKAVVLQMPPRVPEERACPKRMLTRFRLGASRLWRRS